MSIRHLPVQCTCMCVSRTNQPGLYLCKCIYDIIGASGASTYVVKSTRMLSVCLSLCAYVISAHA